MSLANHNRRESVEPLLPNPATQSNDTISDEAEEPNAPLANMGLSYSTAKIVAPLSFLSVLVSFNDTTR